MSPKITKTPNLVKKQNTSPTHIEKDKESSKKTPSTPPKINLKKDKAALHKNVVGGKPDKKPKPEIENFSNKKGEEGGSKAEQRAKEIIKLRGASSKYETFCVAEIRNTKTGKMRTIISSSNESKTAPKNIKLKPSEEFVNPGPTLVRRPMRDADGKIIKDEQGRIKTQTIEKVEDNGEIKEVPYDKSEDKRHHAEQRAKASLGKDEELVEVVPTRPCCPDCQKVLGSDLDKVPEHLNGKK